MFKKVFKILRFERKTVITKIVVCTVFAMMLLMGLIVFISSMLYRNTVMTAYETRVRNMSARMANVLDVEMLNTALEYDNDLYWEQLQIILDLVLYVSDDIQFVYIMRPYDDYRFQYLVSGSMPELRGFVDSPEVYGIDAWLAWHYGIVTSTTAVQTGYWGTLLGGFAPLKDIHGNIIALVGVDVDVSVVNARVVLFIRNVSLLSIIMLIVMIFVVKFFVRSIFNKDFQRLVDMKFDSLVSIENFNVRLKDEYSKDPVDLVYRLFNKACKVMYSLHVDMEKIYYAHVNGRYWEKLDTSKYKGSQLTIVNYVNTLADIHVKRLEQVLDIIREYFEGNFSLELPDDFKDWTWLNESLDMFKNKFFSLRAEMEKIEERIIKGDFEIPELTGTQEWDKILNSLYLLISKAMQEESMSKNRFLAKVSHEIRTPLNTVLGVAERQLQREDLDNYSKESFLRIHKASLLLLTIISDILDFAQISVGRLKLNNNVYETSSLIVDSVQLNISYIDNKNIDFNVKVDKDLPLYLIGDCTRIKQILNNLLSNALKYTDAGSVLLHLFFEKLEDDNILLKIEVEDSGCGMSERQLKSLYSDFVRFNEEVSKDVQGTGLGLAITLQLVKAMNGTIDAKSHLGVGTLFTVSIPQKVHGTSVIGQEIVENLQNIDKLLKFMKKKDPVECADLSEYKVLIVDDVETNLIVAHEFLELYKLNIDVAMSGKEAINLIKAGNTYDIIFMDYMMPELDGVETTKIIRKMDYNRAIVALTANIVAEQDNIFYKNGFSGFLSKPLSLENLDNCLKKHLYLP